MGIWYILRAQRGSHIPTLKPKYILYTYVDPLGPQMSHSLNSLKGVMGDYIPDYYWGYSGDIRSLDYSL